MTDPRTVIDRDLAISRLATDRPRRPMPGAHQRPARMPTEAEAKRLRQFFFENAGRRGFCEMHDITRARLADEAANRKRMGESS